MIYEPKEIEDSSLPMKEDGPILQIMEEEGTPFTEEFDEVDGIPSASEEIEAGDYETL